MFPAIFGKSRDFDRGHENDTKVTMNKNPAVERLAVCSWSLQPANPEDLVSKLAACGVRRVQLALDPLRESPEVWSRTETLFRQHNIAIVSGMFGCVGEDYSTLESIRKTGGIAPDATWEQNRGNIKDTVALAGRMGLKLVTFHAGFIPHKETDPDYAKLLNRLAEAAGMFAAANIALALETGQETASSLAALLKKLRRPNLGVNFDPANMILYNQGDPIEAVRALAPWIRQVHIKDATRTKAPGTWGREVAAGTGEVDWPAFFATLRQLNFKGDFVIEREAGTRRAPDIITARAVVEKNLA
jgi:sugar phosphate isomerase/epimerase